MSFSLPAPASVEWYRKGVPGGGQKDRIFNRLKAKLIGGKDDSGTGYFPMHDRKISSQQADTIIANMKKDTDGYPMLQTGSTSGEAEREYQEWIIDRYLVEVQEPEEIPVEVEVVEVEQKTIDEPIVVKIEAPFVPEPQKKLEAPKRIRLPRRSGIMKARPIALPKQEKKNVADRMSDAFDKNLLDPLLDGIKNPPPPSQPKQRKQTETLSKIRSKVKPAKLDSKFKEAKGGPKFFENTGAFLFNKTRNAFRRAAETRRMAAEQGMPEQNKRFYVKRALGFEFGGDAIARTRGTFAKNPDATLDPSLTKQQRYNAGIFGTRTIRSPKKSKTEGDIDVLTKKISEIDKKFQEVIDTKQSGRSTKDTTDELDKTLKELSEKLKTGNKLQKDINASKSKLLSLEAKAADQAQAAAEEAETDKNEDLSGFVDELKQSELPGNRGGGLPSNPFKWLKNFRKNAGKWWKRIKNPGRTLQSFGRLARAKFSRFLRRIPGGKGLANRVSNIRVGNPFKNLKLPGMPKGTGGAGGAGGILSRLRGIKIPPGLARAGGMLRGLGGKLLLPLMLLDVYEQTKRVFNPNNNIITALQDFGQANVDMFKALTGGGDPFESALVPQRGDYSQMEEGSQEWTSYKINMNRNRHVLAKRQAADPERYNKEKDSVLQKHPYVKDFYDNPDPQNRFNLRPPDVSQYGDIPEGYELKKQDDGTWKMVKKEEEKLSAGGTVKLASGGVNAMVGEAGPELVMTPGSGGMNPLQSLAPMIAAMREVTKRAGTWADPVENLVRQSTDSIAKAIRLPVIPSSIDIGQNVSGGNQGEQKGDGILDKIAEFLGGKRSKKKKSGGDMDIPPPVAMGEGNDFWTLAAIASVEDGNPQGHADVAQSIYNRVHDSVANGAGYGKTVWEVVTADAQYQPAYMDPTATGGAGAKTDPIWKSINSLDTAAAAVASYYSKRGQSTTPDQVKGQVQAAANHIKDSSKQASARQFVGSRTEFLASAPGEDVVQRPEGGNAFFWAYGSGKMKGQGAAAIPTMGTNTAPGGTLSTPATGNVAVGDSVANQVPSSMVTRRFATDGNNPSQVLSTLRNNVRGSGAHVILSTGLSNNPDQIAQVRQQMEHLSANNRPFTVIPLVTGVRNARSLNDQLAVMARQHGGRLASELRGSAIANDGYNAHYANSDDFLKMRLGRN